jgi:hypothetical protein
MPEGEGAAVVGEVCLICTPTRGFHEQVAGLPPPCLSFAFAFA